MNIIKALAHLIFVLASHFVSYLITVMFSQSINHVSHRREGLLLLNLGHECLRPMVSEDTKFIRHCPGKVEFKAKCFHTIHIAHPAALSRTSEPELVTCSRICLSVIGDCIIL